MPFNESTSPLFLRQGAHAKDFVELFGNHALTNLLARNEHIDESELFNMFVSD